ncbi:MAG: GDSL-type esterase/lipase family protein [Deltaproteobacteria bacterium]|nr:GDSL-type esterase/lipase family protein [Deltaproteobacteria bacterium]
MSRLASCVALAVLLLGSGACRTAPSRLDRNGDGVVRVVCLGDSNSALGDPRVGDTWCEYLAARFPDWQFVNQGKGFARATGDTMLWGKALLQHVWRAAPDVLFIALGTNDLVAARQSPETAVAALLDFRAEAQRRNIEVAIATVPPALQQSPELQANIAAANRLLAAALPADRLIDFTSGLSEADFLPDGIHVNSRGQRKRADAAAATVHALGGVERGPFPLPRGAATP